MIFDSQFSPMNMLVTGCLALFAVVLLLIRFFSRKGPYRGGERRVNLKLRLVLSVILIAAIGAMAAYIIFTCWKIWRVAQFDNINFLSPTLFLSSGGIVGYAFLMVGIVLLIRTPKNKQRPPGAERRTERRRQRLLRYALNFLMAAPVMGLIAAFLIRVLNN